MLYEAFPEAGEGELSRRLAGLVRKESCAEVALAWGVDSCLRLGEIEQQTRTPNLAILGDVCESIIGAVFLDAGYEAAKAVVIAAFGERMHSPGRPLRDPKTALQEWAQARGLPTPLYRETARSGPDHAPEFTISVEVPGYRNAEAKGFAKRLAEQAAAAAFIARESIGQDVQKGAS
jgi:ribonuclease III